MGSAPQLLPTSVPEGQTPGITYRIEGELVPVLHLRVDGKVPVYFEHHVVLWKSPALDIVMRPLKGGVKRAIAGMQIFVTETKGIGEIAFSRDGAGHIFPIHLSAGQDVLVREHQFLAATATIGYTFERVKGVSNVLFGGTGFFVDRFHGEGEGVVWLHGYGNVFEKVLEPGEQIDVEPGGWIYREGSVRMETIYVGMRTGMFGGANLAFNRFTGPGRVGIQSMYVHLATET